jgi:hypothetical protein
MCNFNYVTQRRSVNATVSIILQAHRKSVLIKPASRANAPCNRAERQFPQRDPA